MRRHDPLSPHFDSPEAKLIELKEAVERGIDKLIDDVRRGVIRVGIEVGPTALYLLEENNFRGIVESVAEKHGAEERSVEGIMAHAVKYGNEALKIALKKVVDESAANDPWATREVPLFQEE